MRVSWKSIVVAGVVGIGAVQLAPGGSVEYALVASIPKGRKATQVVLNLPASSVETATSGAIVTIETGDR